MTTDLHRSGSPGWHPRANDRVPTAAELLVGHGFRGWISGYQTGDISHWERVWRLYSSVLSPQTARATVSCLSGWAKSVQAASRRRLVVGNAEACRFCRDECLAISMIAASQHSTCPAMRACAFALIESELVDEVVDHAETFAVMLRGSDKIVSPQWIVNANSFCDPDPRLPH